MLVMEFLAGFAFGCAFMMVVFAVVEKIVKGEKI